MGIYFFIFMLVALNVFIKQRVFNFIVVVLSALFLCTGYYTGSDWRTYEAKYEISNILSFNTDETFVELGYFVYSALCRFFMIDFWFFFIITKLILFVLCVYILYTRYNSIWKTSFFLFFSFFSLSFFIDNPMRNLIAIVISLFGYKFLFDKKLLKFYLIVTLASFFHLSSVFLFVLPFFVRLKLTPKKVFMMYLLMYLLMYLSIDIVTYLITNYYYYLGTIGERVGVYFLDEGNKEVLGRSFSLGFLLRTTLFALCCRFQESGKLYIPYKREYFNLFSLYMFLYMISIFIPLFIRFQLFLFLFYCVYVGYYMLNSLMRRNLIAYLYVFLFSMSYLYITITSDYKYIPYTSYLVAMYNKDFPSYNYRSSYNLKYSPYNK